MTEERDLAGFALPFVCGVIYAHTFLPAGNLGLNALIPTSTCILLGLSIDRNHGRFHPAYSWAFIIILAFMTGMICSQTGKLTSFSSSAHTGFLHSATASWCRSLSASIDSIPFDNSETPALIKALLTGDRSSIPDETKEAFRASGASHILALSGMHLGIIYGIIRKLLTFCGNSPDAIKAKAMACISICGAYTMAVGSGDSITRAFLFISIREISSITNRSQRLSTTLLTALIIQLTIRPESISSISFQLSYAAMAGIAYIHPIMKDFWPTDSRKGIMGKIWDTASLSISCQVTTGPLAWFHFHTFPKHFILTNMIAMPLTAIIIPSSLLTLMLHGLGLCPGIIIKATESLVHALTAALKIIASM